MTPIARARHLVGRPVRRRFVVLVALCAVVVPAGAIGSPTQTAGSAMSTGLVGRAATAQTACGYAGVVGADRPVAFWRLEEGVGSTVAADAVGGHAGSYVGSPLLAQSGAFAGSLAPSFDGVDDAVRVAGVPNAGTLTVEAWARSAGPAWNAHGFLVSKRGSFILHPVQGSKGMRFYVWTTGGSVVLARWDDPGAGFEITRWHHYVGSYDGVTVRLYVDGVERGSAAAVAQARDDGSALWIGQDDLLSGRNGQGQIDEVALYDGALAAARIKTHYDTAAACTDVLTHALVYAGQQLTWTANHPPLEELIKSGGNSWLPSHTAVFGTADTTWQVHKYWGDWVAAFYPGLLWLKYRETGDELWKALAEKWTKTALCPDGFAADKCKVALQDIDHDMGFRMLAFLNAYDRTRDDAYRQLVLTGAHTLTPGNTTAVDSSDGSPAGTRHNGDYLGFGGAPPAVSPATGSVFGSEAPLFDGKDDAVRIDGVPNASTLTIEAWAKSTGPAWNAHGFLVSKRNSFILHPLQGGNGMQFYVFTSGGQLAVASWDNPGPSFDIRQWHHYVGTYDGAALRLYVDGVERASAPAPGQAVDDHSPLWIGQDDGLSGRNGNAWIDEVALYAGALSGTQIKVHYDAAAVPCQAADDLRCYPNKVRLADRATGYWRLDEKRRFDDTFQTFRSFNAEADASGRLTFTTIIDNMMNLELLFWASENAQGTAFATDGSTDRWYREAVAHAKTVLANQIRRTPSGWSACRFIVYDLTAQPPNLHPACGVKDATSTWARGQAWALYGFTTTYAHTRGKSPEAPSFLEAAENLARFFVRNLPDDHVPYFDLGKTSGIRDSSAAAIAASALVQLSELEKAEGRPTEEKEFRDDAQQILLSLARTYLSEGQTVFNPAILLHGETEPSSTVQEDRGTIWGDYYFVEALLRYLGK
jgi:hypothetical protein